jgi:hypothetical protein
MQREAARGGSAAELPTKLRMLLVRQAFWGEMGPPCMCIFVNSITLFLPRWMMMGRAKQPIYWFLCWMTTTLPTRNGCTGGFASACGMRNPSFEILTRGVSWCAQFRLVVVDVAQHEPNLREPSLVTCCTTNEGTKGCLIE